MKRRTINLGSNLRARFAHHIAVAFGVVVAVLLMTGCTSESASSFDTVQAKVTGPTPPMQPAIFSDFDQRALIPERIVITSIELDTSVVDLGWSEVTGPAGRIFNDWNVAAYAAGWHANSDKLDQGGNVVLSGHNNIQGAVFKKLDQLQAGDVATIWSGNRAYAYEIDEVVIVPERGATHEQRIENARWIGDFDDDRLTLVSC